MQKRDELVCEVCGGPIEPGDAVVLGQETARVELSGVLGPGSDGRLAMFHEEHWPERIGEWLERDRGHATER